MGDDEASSSSVVNSRKRGADSASLSQSSSSLKRPEAGTINLFLTRNSRNTNTSAGSGVLSRSQSYNSQTGDSSDHTDLDMSRDSSQDSRSSSRNNIRGSSPIDSIGIAELSSPAIPENFLPLPNKVVMKTLSDSLGYERSSLTDSQRKCVGQKEGTRTPISKTSNTQLNIKKFGLTVLDVSKLCNILFLFLFSISLICITAV